MNKKGVFVISLDTELAWGFIDKNISEKKKIAIKSTRKNIKEILYLFEKYNFSATWAVVGQLMLDGCILKNGIKYPLIIRPNYKWYKKDWFEKIPLNKRDNNSIWFDKKIIEMIMNCKVKQEIASHSFSHIVFGDEGCSKECAESDIKKCIEIARKNNIIFRSFIFPRNSEGYKNLLNKNGFICYRGKENVLYKKIKNKYYRKLIHLIKETFAISPESYKIGIDENGLVNIKASMLYLSRDGIRKYIPIKNRVIRAKKGIDQAIKNKEVFHMWFHPQNICNDSKNLLSGLEQILCYSKNKVEQGYLKNLTMKEIAEPNLLSEVHE